jgi:acyl transferase domain-containing protein/acyl carrier protein
MGRGNPAPSPNGRRSRHDGIAIIGMSGRFPGAPTIDRFWDNLRHGVESVTPFSRSRLKAAGVDDSAFENPHYVPMGSVLEDVDLFDAAFFGFSPREAESLDPQQRLFLETSWHALEDAGYDPATFPGLIGVYGGCAMSSYLDHLESNPEFMSLLGYLQIYIGNDKDYLATRISYALDLKGPSFSIQTACSTSLLAVAVAGDQLLSHQCDMALAGGVCVRVPQEEGYYFEPGGIFSPDGHCRVFDEQAAGVVFGNGVGAVVLRRLSDAIADGDPILAVVKGWAVNNDGAAKASYAAPSLDGQADVIARAHAHAGVNPETITYVEAHGTGTPVGDPIEIGALTRAFRLSTAKKSFCAVGSVKTNVGHLDPAAGVASLIKTVLALEHREIPPSLNCTTINPAIELDGSPFYVNTELTPWTVNHGSRRAGISGFGIGGTNVHLVLEEAPPVEMGSDDRTHQLMVLSAKSSSALQSAAENLAEHLVLNPELDPADVAYTMQVGRRAMDYRCAAVYRDIDDLVGALAEPDGGRLIALPAPPRSNLSVAFMFSGQGAQYANMARGLYESEPRFRESLDACAQILKSVVSFDLRTILYSARGHLAAQKRLTQTAVTQPALFALEYSLAQLWMQWGIHPDTMIGHSIGEYVAACLAGVFSLEDGLKLVAERGRLMQSLPHGSMLAVALSEAELGPMLGDELDLAAVNEMQLSVVSGATNAIEAFQQRLSRDGVSCRRLHTSHAFHSRMMDEILDAFGDQVGALTLSPPRIPYVSNLTGQPITDEQSTSPEYWVRHLRRPVLFARGLSHLLADPGRVLLEVGPGQTLCAFARRHPGRSPEQLVVATLRHARQEGADSAVMLESLARLWLAGATVDWPGVHAPARARRVHLPGYPFERHRYWAEAEGIGENAPASVFKEPDIADWFYAPRWEYALAPEPDPALTQKRWLIFGDGELSAYVEGQLSQADQDVTVVRQGSGFRSAENVYTLDPRQPADYKALFTQLAAEGRLPEHILHLWSVAPVPAALPALDRFERQQALGFYSLVYLVQALLTQGVVTPVQIIVASTDLHGLSDHDQIAPEKATLLGACRAIVQEYPHLACRSIDIVLRPGDGAAEARTAGQLLAEFSDEALSPTVAYRQGQRWLLSFEPVTAEESDVTMFPLRRRGVYLITGGLGRIGLALARELGRAVHARIVLVGRSSLPPRSEWDDWLAEHDQDDATAARIRGVQKVEEQGGAVLIVNADVADPAQVRIAVQSAHAEFGRLDGVIHGAGNVSAEGFFSVEEANPTLCDRQFNAKVRGLLSLEEALTGEQLDFVMLLSSISSVLGGLGYLAYGAANAFMDSFARMQSRTSGTRWISVDWDTWDLDLDDAPGDDPTLLAMSSGEGVDAFRRIISCVFEPQVVVSTGYLADRIEQWVDLRSLRKGLELRDRDADRFHTRPHLATAHISPRNQLERSIAAVWEETLGIRPVGVLDDFFTDLGGNSLLATRLMSRLRAQFGVDIPLSRFFDAPTVTALVESIGAGRQGELVPAPG